VIEIAIVSEKKTDVIKRCWMRGNKETWLLLAAGLKKMDYLFK